jgi:hypothetical protein
VSAASAASTVTTGTVDEKEGSSGIGRVRSTSINIKSVESSLIVVGELRPLSGLEAKVDYRSAGGSPGSCQGVYYK